MDIIQQKLIWLLAGGAIVFLLFKLNLRRTGMDNAVLRRLRIGFALIFCGALFGIIIKIGMSTGKFSRSSEALFVETIAGYVLGWSFIIAAIIRWAKAFFDRKGRPLVTTNARAVSERVAQSLIKGHRPPLLLESLAPELMGVMQCQALSLHKFDKENGLRLIYESGLAAGHKNLIQAPQDRRHMFWTAARTAQAVTTDKDLVFGDGTRLSSEAGPLRSALCAPVRYENNVLGVLTVYRNENRPFFDDDLDLLEIVVDGLGASLENDISDKKHNIISRYREMLLLAARPFENGESLLSALIKSAKLIHGYIPFKKITLYVQGDGEPQDSDFKLSTGGVVSVRSGYFSREEYPELYRETRDPGYWGVSSWGNAASGDNKSYLFDIGRDHNTIANLRIDLGDPAGKSSYLPLLGSSLCQKISERLSEERAARTKERIGQWLGALEHFQAKGLLADNLQSYLTELTSLVVDLAPATFARILFTDNQRKVFRTVSLVQSRQLNWPDNNAANISLPRSALHRRAVESRAVTRFGVETDLDATLGVDELRCLMPRSISHGLIVPLYMGSSAVGVLTVGESRHAGRNSLAADAESFIKSVAALISMVLTWHKDRRTLNQKSEGRKSLKLLKKESNPISLRRVPDSGLRTRLNGPLASIMASCEFLTSRDEGPEKPDLDHYIDVIHRSAARIYDIAQKSGGKEI